MVNVQTLPPPPPKPSAPSVAPTPTPAQQTPTAPSQEPSTEQEPEQSSSQQEQEQEAPQDQGPSTDQLVPQPPVDQNRPPVKPQRRPSAPAPQVLPLLGQPNDSPWHQSTCCTDQFACQGQTGFGILLVTACSCRQVGLLSLQHCIELDTVRLIDQHPDHVTGTAGS